MSSRTDVIVDLIGKALDEYDAEQEANAVRALGPVPDHHPQRPPQWAPTWPRDTI
jgi:hypothetical protein